MVGMKVGESTGRGVLVAEVGGVGGEEDVRFFGGVNGEGGRRPPSC